MIRQITSQSAVNTGTGSIKSDNSRLKEACQDFESIFLSHLMKGLRSTVQKSDLFGSGQEEEMFQEMADQEFCESAARSNSIGLADMLYKQFTVNSTGKTLKPGSVVVEKYSEPVKEGGLK